MNTPTKLSFLALTTVAFALPANRAGADAQQMQQLVPDVTRPRKTDRTHVFARAQFIYSLGNDDYLHHWADRPLLVDPSLDAGKPFAPLMTLPAYEKMQQTVLKYGLDGFAFFPQTTRRALFFDYTRQSALPGFTLLPELVADDQSTTKSDAVKMALATPATLKIDGKAIFTSYVTDSKPVEFWQAELAKLKQEYGDTFRFLPSLVYFNGQGPQYWQEKYHKNTITAQDVEGVKEYLRKWLRATDGLYCAYAAGFHSEGRTFDADFYQNFIIRLMKSVLVEPEFKDKLFGLSAVVGHENVTRFGYTLSSDATKTLRRSFEAAMSAQPDLINIPEWDEQNENTSLRPTVYNGYTSMRLMRYYTAKLRGTQPQPIPGDDTTIPNLLVSYRKALTLGEKLQIELLQVPDSAQGMPCTVRLSLQDATGKTVYTAPPQKFQGSRLEDHTLVVPSESLATYQALRPRVEIESGGRTRTFEDGLQYIDLNATSNWDYKWVKQGLRDLMQPSKADLQVGAPDAEGKRVVTATFDAAEPLAYVEVLDDNDTVYSYAADDNWRENADQVIVRLAWTAFGGRGNGLKLQGNITLQDAKGRWLVDKNAYDPVLKDQTLTFDGKIASIWRSRAMIAIPRSAIDKGTFKIDLPGIFQGNVSLKDLMAKGIYGIPGPKGFNLVFSRYLSQDTLPLNINANSVSFNVPVLPEQFHSVLHLQAISKAGHVYQGKPIVLSPSTSARRQIIVYSDTAKQPEPVQVAADRAPDIRYRFDPSHGTVLMTDAGRPYWGALGGYFAQVTGRGGGNAGDDTPFIDARSLPADIGKTAPDWVKGDDGQYALQFDGKGTFIALPQGVIPRRAAFTIDMDIKPDTATGKQFIIGHRSYYPGSLVFYTENGVLKADFLGENDAKNGLDSTLTLAAGAWHHLTIRYDQKNVVLTVDGKSSPPLAVAGPGIYETASVVGGYDKDWFAGQIKNLRIRHFVDPATP